MPTVAGSRRPWTAWIDRFYSPRRCSSEADGSRGDVDPEAGDSAYSAEVLGSHPESPDRTQAGTD